MKNKMEVYNLSTENTSLDSDDTDYLLSRHSSFAVRDDYSKSKVNITEKTIRTQSYVNDLFEQPFLSPPSRNDQSLSFYNKENNSLQNISASSLKSISPSYNIKSAGKKVSFEDEANSTGKELFKDLQLYKPNKKINNPIHSSASSVKELSFDDVDEKVKEGQEILKKLLSESKVSSQYKESSLNSNNEASTSIDDYLKKETHQDSKSMINTPIEQNSFNKYHSVNNTSLSPFLNENKSPLPNNFNILSYQLFPPEEQTTDLLNNNSVEPAEKGISHQQSEKLESIDCAVKENLGNEIVADGIYTNITSQEEDDTDQVVVNLTDNVGILQQQNTNLTDHVNHLRDSLAKKNKKCLEYQEDIHNKDRQIHKLLTSDDLERQNLQNEVTQLQAKEKLLNKQVNDMEKAINKQCNEINDLEEKMQTEKRLCQSILKEKDEKIVSTDNLISELQEKLNKSNMDSCINEKVQSCLHEAEKPLLLEISKLKEKLKQGRGKEEYGMQYKLVQREKEVEHTLHTKKLEEDIQNLININDSLQIENGRIKHNYETVFKDHCTLNKLICNKNKEIESLRKELDAVLLKLNAELESKETSNQQHYIEYEKYKANVDTLRNKNNKMKEQLSLLTARISEKEDNTTSQQPLDDIVKAFKKKLAKKERDEKSLALELIEESTKLDAISGFTPSDGNLGVFNTRPVHDVSAAGLNEEKPMITEVLDIFKIHLDFFRTYTLTLRKENEQIHLSQSNDESFTTSSPVNTQTSTKLLRHLQNRVQQLRKENSALKQDSEDAVKSNASFNSSAEHVEKRVEELELTLQKCELETKKNTNTLYQKNVDIKKLQKIISQISKENMRLEKAYASLLQSVADTKQLDIKPSDFLPLPSTHSEALGPNYHGTFIQKLSFPLEYIKWDVEYPVYFPAEYTSTSVLANPAWADNDIRYTKENVKFNELDGPVDRRSHMGTYQVINGTPRNPIGRTGMTGRGLLGRWGPNHAADPIVTRWAHTPEGDIKTKENLPILEFISIIRKDTLQWAIPGGMVDAGEHVSATLKREFGEEALNSQELDQRARDEMYSRINELFQNGLVIYKGYVDDPRNTDNAWMETIAVNFHDNNGDSVAKIPLNAGDDANDVCWLPIDGRLNLYASHYDFIKQTCVLRNAYFEE